ncbi:MAG: hypothetical protein QW348_08920 [Ignisphaera sp.]
MVNSLVEELREERRRNLEDVIRNARWEAEMVRKLGIKWFEQRDKWLIEAWKADREMWKDPRVREALIKTILAKDRPTKRSPQ